ncbi:Bifunctional monodehydroascorbate reductase and carbonic anhydrase nectarin-3 [Acorus gramineus]|uniref:Carbonic anhydrase n=1 Tax=Acorus gramineus TaxID=55184 RepID=A0AAV9BSK6_ACOGR|nr:Bifunctional monodehydroascorbate reductase and carbonic anhydrase nectarin-3 [Acorus gramineus]
MAFKNFIIFSLCLSLILTNFTPATSQEVDDEHEFSYEVDSETGPAHWGEIHKDWEVCNKGELQSPIDLSNRRVEVVSHLGQLKRSYRPSHAIMMNRGHDIMLKWEDGAGSIWVNETEYTLKQLHWHWPSEHTINGRRFTMELHMVHESADNKVAVVGILYKIGRADNFLHKMANYIRKMTDIVDGREDVGIVDPREIRRGSRKYYRYIGSLTTPPCTEGVVWTIMGKIRTVSREQVKLLQEAVHDDTEKNARPVQAIHDRMIHFFRPRKVQY